MLDKRTILLYSNTGVEKHNAAVAQSVERRIGSAEVTGPIPVSSSSKEGCVAVTIENSLLQPFLF